jgi:hypothetical protein
MSDMTDKYKGKVKFSLCVWGRGYIDPHFLGSALAGSE